MQRLSFPREVLLVEIERRCAFPDCSARNLVSLTKPEAIDYRGFECFLCERWNDDGLRDADVPDWWNEVRSAATGHLQ